MDSLSRVACSDVTKASAAKPLPLASTLTPNDYTARDLRSKKLKARRKRYKGALKTEDSPGKYTDVV